MPDRKVEEMDQMLPKEKMLHSQEGFDFKVQGTAAKLDWVDVSCEAYREYVFRDGTKFRVDRPQFLAVSQAGHSHRVICAPTHDGLGKLVTVPDGWIALECYTKLGQPACVK
jgi:hypothetical protein